MQKETPYTVKIGLETGQVVLIELSKLGIDGAPLDEDNYTVLPTFTHQNTICDNRTVVYPLLFQKMYGDPSVFSYFPSEKNSNYVFSVVEKFGVDLKNINSEKNMCLLKKNFSNLKLIGKTIPL